MRHFKIAIDGPAGSGKSTVSKLLADKLNYTYIDTGALYRAVTYYALTKKLNLDLELSFHFLENIKLDFQNNNIFLNEYDVSKEIRINEVSNNVATVASHKYVRNKLVNIMRSLSYNHNVVMDGRDVGSVVFPNAELKIFLTADINERARRRILETNGDVALNLMIKDIEERDYKDMNRKESPLVICDDAIVIDSTNMSINEVLETIIKLMKDRALI